MVLWIFVAKFENYAKKTKGNKVVRIRPTFVRRIRPVPKRVKILYTGILIFFYVRHFLQRSFGALWSEEIIINA